MALLVEDVIFDDDSPMPARDNVDWTHGVGPTLLGLGKAVFADASPDNPCTLNELTARHEGYPSLHRTMDEATEQIRVCDHRSRFSLKETTGWEFRVYMASIRLL